MIAAVQQRLVPVGELAEQVALVRWHPRRRLLRALSADVASGVESMGELEFTKMCAVRRFPPLARQVRRTTPSGRIYLDVRFRTYPVSVEIDGAQHLDAGAAAGDALKQNAALEGDIVIRIPVWALRTDPHPFLDQVDAALKRCGWRGPDASG